MFEELSHTANDFEFMPSSLYAGAADIEPRPAWVGRCVHGEICGHWCDPCNDGDDGLSYEDAAW